MPSKGRRTAGLPRRSSKPAAVPHFGFRAISLQSILVSRLVAKTRPTFRCLWRESGIPIDAPDARSQIERATHDEWPSLERLDSAHPYIRSALLSEAVSANLPQRIAASDIVSCSSADTFNKMSYCGAMRKSAPAKAGRLPEWPPAPRRAPLFYSGQVTSAVNAGSRDLRQSKLGPIPLRARYPYQIREPCARRGLRCCNYLLKCFPSQSLWRLGVPWVNLFLPALCLRQPEFCGRGRFADMSMAKASSWPIRMASRSRAGPSRVGSGTRPLRRGGSGGRSARLARGYRPGAGCGPRSCSPGRGTRSRWRRGISRGVGTSGG